MPPFTIIHISQCAASPSRWPCAPMLTLTPARDSSCDLARHASRTFQSSSGAVSRRTVLASSNGRGT